LPGLENMLNESKQIWRVSGNDAHLKNRLHNFSLIFWKYLSQCDSRKINTKTKNL